MNINDFILDILWDLGMECFILASLDFWRDCHVLRFQPDVSMLVN